MASPRHPSLGRGDEDGRQAPPNSSTKDGDAGDAGDGRLGKGEQTKKDVKQGKHPLDTNNDSSFSMSFSMSRIHSPELVDRPLKPVRRIAAELKDVQKLKQHEKDEASESIITGPKNGGGRSLNGNLHDSSIVNVIRGFGGDKSKEPKVISHEKDKVDVEYNRAAESLDGIVEPLDEAIESSDAFAASTKELNSPYVNEPGTRHAFPSVARSDPGSFGASETTWTAKLTEEGEWGTDCGSSDWSAFDTGTYDRGASDAEKKETSIKNSKPDSPTLGTGLAAQGLPLPGLGQHIGGKSPVSPNPTLSTIATASTSTRAERNLHVPFLPESLWLRQNSAGTTRIDRGPGVESKELVSVFEDETSDEELNKATFHTAIRKRFARPHIVGRGSSSVVIGLKEMLRTTGPEGPKNKPGPSKEKAGKCPRKKNRYFQLSSSKRAGVVGLPTAEPEDGRPLPDGANNPIRTPVGLGIQQEPVGNPPDGLRSHPPRRAATAPTRKRVSFPTPSSLEIRPEHGSLRQTIVTTPYPALPPAVPEKSDPDANHRREVMLTLVIHNFQTRVPLTKKLVVPGSRPITLEDSSHERKPKIMATLDVNFDDEKLAKLIQKEYFGMRGVFRSIFSARNVQDVKIFSYATTSDLVDKIDSASSNPFILPENRDLGEAQMLALYRKPRLGRRKYAWLVWIARRPENSPRLASGKQNLALQLVEGWCIWKIASTLLTILALSAAATLLWVFLGIGGDSWTRPSMNAPSDPGLSTENQYIQESHAGFRGAGGRVQTGVLLGALVLMLGWTGTGAWILLSWLT